jgi:acyl-coenzyme A synthetase/AMP-(fatty) acid ligase
MQMEPITRPLPKTLTGKIRRIELRESERARSDPGRGG